MYPSTREAAENISAVTPAKAGATGKIDVPDGSLAVYQPSKRPPSAKSQMK